MDKPIVFVVAEPEVHAALRGCADLDVWVNVFNSADEFDAVVRGGGVPLDREPAVIVVSDTHLGAAPRGFLETFEGYCVLVDWGGRINAPGAIKADMPLTLNTLRAAVGACAEEVLDEADNGDAPIRVPGRQEGPTASREQMLAAFEIDDRPATRPATNSAARLKALLEQQPPETGDAPLPPAVGPAVEPPSWSPKWDQVASAPKPQTVAERVGYSDNETRDPKACKVLCVYSAKGGVGKTSMSLNLAARLQAVTDMRVAVMDIDVEFGDVASRLGVYSPTLIDLVRAPRITDAEIDKLPVDPASGITCVLAPLQPKVRPEGAEGRNAFSLLTPGSLTRVLDALKRRFDAVIIDCSVELANPLVSQFAMPQASMIAYVVNNEQATLHEARKALTSMVSSPTAPVAPGVGLRKEKIALLVNQLVDDVGITGGEVGQMLAGWPIAAFIPDNRQLWVGEANEKRLLAMSDREDVTAQLDQALSVFFPGVALKRPEPAYRARVAEQPSAPEEKPGLLARLLGRK